MLQIDLHSVDEILGNPVALVRTELQHTLQRLPDVNLDKLSKEELRDLHQSLMFVRNSLNKIVRARMQDIQGTARPSTEDLYSGLVDLTDEI